MKEANRGLERVHFALRSSGVQDEENNPQRSGIHFRGYLPHVKQEGASYFVTFRLADSLPSEVFFQLVTERTQRLQKYRIMKESFQTGLIPSPPEVTEQEIHAMFQTQIERYLDRGAGECYLARAPIAELVSDAIRFFEGKRYLVHEWVVMPNHAHVVVWPMPNELLGSIVRSWKGFTARKANQILGRVGLPFWQTESYDHWIRNDDEKARICNYVVNNPVKAKLCRLPEEWRWSSAWSGWRSQNLAP